MLTLDKIYHAAFVLRDVARRTDLIAASRLNSASDLYLKTENLQVTGSFKVRGAYYKISQLTAEERAKGVIACSAGNHAQGVALAATSMGIKSVVCMPDGAPLMKVESFVTPVAPMGPFRMTVPSASMPSALASVMLKCRPLPSTPT